VKSQILFTFALLVTATGCRPTSTEVQTARQSWDHANEAVKNAGIPPSPPCATGSPAQAQVQPPPQAVASTAGTGKIQAAEPPAVTSSASEPAKAECPETIPTVSNPKAEFERRMENLARAPAGSFQREAFEKLRKLEASWRENPMSYAVALGRRVDFSLARDKDKGDWVIHYARLDNDPTENGCKRIDASTTMADTNFSSGAAVQNHELRGTDPNALVRQAFLDALYNRAANIALQSGFVNDYAMTSQGAELIAGYKPSERDQDTMRRFRALEDVQAGFEKRINSKQVFTLDSELLNRAGPMMEPNFTFSLQPQGKGKWDVAFRRMSSLFNGHYSRELNAVVYGFNTPREVEKLHITPQMVRGSTDPFAAIAETQRMYLADPQNFERERAE
jgi:hypothetical protein